MVDKDFDKISYEDPGGSKEHSTPLRLKPAVLMLPITKGMDKI